MVSKEYAMETLHLTEEEYATLEKWHKQVTGGRTYFGTIGGELDFIITPTSLGEIIEVRYGNEKIVLRELH